MRLASFLQCFQQEILIIDHEALYFRLAEALMLEFALWDFAHAGAVEPLAGETGEIMAEGALSGPSVAIASQCKLAQLINFRGCGIIHLSV